jgi:hypothetical protein
MSNRKPHVYFAQPLLYFFTFYVFRESLSTYDLKTLRHVMLMSLLRYILTQCGLNPNSCECSYKQSNVWRNIGSINSFQNLMFLQYIVCDGPKNDIILFLDAFARFRKATISFVMSVCSSGWNNLAPTARILLTFYIWDFFENMSRKFKFH